MSVNTPSVITITVILALLLPKSVVTVYKNSADYNTYSLAYEKHVRMCTLILMEFITDVPQAQALTKVDYFLYSPKVSNYLSALHE